MKKAQTMTQQSESETAVALANEIDAALDHYLNTAPDMNGSKAIACEKLQQVLWDNKAGIVAALRTPSQPAASGGSVYSDQPIFDAIAAATQIDTHPDGIPRIVMSARKFIEVFNNHRDRHLCTSIPIVTQTPREFDIRSDEDWRRALNLAHNIMEKYHARHQISTEAGRRAELDNAMQHAFGILSLCRAPAQSPLLRDTVIKECAEVCDKHARWAEDKIEDDPASTRSQIFAGISNTANDCAAMIRDLHGAPAQSPLDAVHAALFEPCEADAIDNLEGALIDIKRLSEQGKPTDQICIRTLERVQAQLLAAHAICEGSAATSTNPPLPNDRRSAMAELQYEAGMYQSLYENAVETCATMALEQRCDRDTPWDLACTTIAEKIRDLALSSTERNTMLIPNTRASGFLRGRRSEDD